MVAVRKDYAAPTGLEFVLVWGSTKMPRRRRCGGKAAEGRRSPRRWRVDRGFPQARSVLDCASPLALWPGGK